MFFSASDVCVLPYRTATQSGIVGIAYHFDLPVIVTNVGGLAEMVEGNKTGLIINSINAKEITNVISRYFKENLKEKFLPNIGEYRIKHSWINLAEQYCNIYRVIFHEKYLIKIILDLL